MRQLAPLLAVVLAACATVRPEPAPSWTVQASATAGSALIAADARGEVLRIACRRNPADLYVASPRLDDRAPVTLQVGDERFELAARDGAATAPIPPALPAALMAGGAIALGQGRTRLGPYPAPDAKTVAAFAIACRG
jgi:hypothetical protein